MTQALHALARRKGAPFMSLPILTILVAEGWVTHTDWRPLKLIAVASLTDRHYSQVQRAIRWLVEEGYLELQHHAGYDRLYRVRG